MLARLPLPYLLLLAAFATFIFCLAVEKIIEIRKLTVACAVISAGCCFGMIIMGSLQYQEWSAEHMLVLYSFGWIGFSIGLIPFRKPYSEYAEERRRGVMREKYEYAKWRPLVTVASVIVMGTVDISSRRDGTPHKARRRPRPRAAPTCPS